MSKTAQDQWSAIQTQVNERLRQYCEEQQKSASERNHAEGRLWELLSDVVLAGGKRLRPYLVMLAYRAYGGKDEKKILDVAAAWELLHQAMLIHDDIIDRDYMRHGQLNVAGKLHKTYTNAPNTLDREHFANSGALLAGDLALSSSYQLFLRSNFDQTELYEAIRGLGNTVSTVIGGELLDTEAVMESIGSTDSTLIAEMKTASYSFVGPLQCGARLAGASDKELRSLAELGKALGIAFQLSDDILGLFGNEEETGKSNSSDIYEGKRTVLVQYAMESNDPTEKAVIESTLGNLDADHEQIEQFRYVIKSTGALDRTQDLVSTHLDRADELLEELSITDREMLEELERLIQKLRQRKS